MTQMKAVTFEVVGDQRLHCESCELRVRRLLKNLPGIGQVRADSRTQRVEVLFDSAAVDVPAIADRLATAGYETKVV